MIPKRAWCGIAALILLGCFGCKAPARKVGNERAGDPPAEVSIITAPALNEAASHGIDRIVGALRAKHIPFERVRTPEAAKGQMLIFAGLATNEIFAGDIFKAFVQSVPTNAEALAAQKNEYQGKPAVAIAGADSTGLMYAALDVADRIGWSKDPAAPFSEVRDTIEKPDMPTRSVTLFAMNRAYWESRFYDTNYWERYFDMLAENRFNSILVTFGYEDGGFLAPCYPYFFDVPKFPGVKMIGITAEQQKKNTDALNRLIAMAHARGVHFTVGIWDHIYRGGVQSGGSPLGNEGVTNPTPNLVWGMNATNLISYTQAALTIFMKQFPGIDGIQFRMHDESGLKVSEQGRFWRAIFHTMKEIAPDLPLDLRAKGLTHEEIQAAEDSGVDFHLSTKFWEEQMGMPFHPTHVNPRDQSSARHSYAGLLVYPQRYWIDWQLWNGGTDRIFLFGDPDYARRFVDSAHLYGGRSFQIDEPLATKMEAQPHDAKPFDLMKPSARYYDYEFERYWHLFQTFGRIGYNTNAPSEIWDHEFENRFGPEAGPILERALHRASWILPRIVASSYPYTGFPMTVGWPEKQHLGDLPVFARATLSDVQVFENFDEEAQLLTNKGETAKVRPQETSRWFAQTADEVEREVAEAEKKSGANHSKEFDSTVLDLKMLADLAQYHSQRDLAAVSYCLYDRTKDPVTLDDAIAYEQKAIAAWREMVKTAGDTYAPDLMFGARKRDLCGNWRDELAELENGLAKLEAERKNLPSDQIFNPSPRCVAFTNEPVGPTIVHEGIRNLPLGQPLVIRAKVTAPSGLKWVQVLYRPVDQRRNYEVMEMKRVDENGNYEAVIPTDKINPQFDFMYFLQAMDNEHHGVMYPDFKKQTPYYFVHLERE
ncbi:MAG TPA: hypothetical protein VN873_08980 [Candidatus Angelobacter sp.]|nr:hypothetical protein [Candidatus Angelobacter sp.]